MSHALPPARLPQPVRRLWPAWGPIPGSRRWCLLAPLLCSLLATPPARADFEDKLPTVPPSLTPPPTAAPKTQSQEDETPVEKPRPEAATTSQPAGPAAASPPAGSPTAKPESSAGGGLLSPDLTRHDVQAPLTYTGDNLEGSRKDGVVVLSGHVDLTQADTNVKADRAELFMQPGTSSPERAIAKGKVRITKKPSPLVPKIYAVAEEIEYFVIGRKAILKGKPKIWRGEEVLQGEVIELDLDTSAIKVKGPRGTVDPKSQGRPRDSAEASQASSPGAATKSRAKTCAPGSKDCAKNGKPVSEAAGKVP